MKWCPVNDPWWAGFVWGGLVGAVIEYFFSTVAYIINQRHQREMLKVDADLDALMKKFMEEKKP